MDKFHVENVVEDLGKNFVGEPADPAEAVAILSKSATQEVQGIDDGLRASLVGCRKSSNGER